MSRERAVPLTIGKGNAVLPPACNFQPQQSIVIFNLPLSEHAGLVLPLRSSLLTHYLSCLRGERKQEAGLQSLQDCSTHYLITSAHFPVGKYDPRSREGQSILPSKLQLLLTGVCRQPGQRTEGSSWPGKGEEHHPRVVGDSPKEWKGRTSHIWAKSMCERGEGCCNPRWSAGTSPECEHPHLSSPFQQDPLLSISEQPQVPIAWAKPVKIPAATGERICTA